MHNLVMEGTNRVQQDQFEWILTTFRAIKTMRLHRRCK